MSLRDERADDDIHHCGKSDLHSLPPSVPPWLLQTPSIGLAAREKTTPCELAELFGVTRSIVYRAIERARQAAS
jgi:hypothetical protein